MNKRVYLLISRIAAMGLASCAGYGADDLLSTMTFDDIGTTEYQG